LVSGCQDSGLTSPGLAGSIKINDEIVVAVRAVDNIKTPLHGDKIFFLAAGADNEFFLLLNFHNYARF
jgi:hypothetical protein